MARIKLIQKDEASEDVRQLFQKIEGNGARILNLYRAVAASPSTASSFLKLGNLLLRKAELSQKLRELAILRIAKLTGSDYEWTQHVQIALGAGVGQPQIEDIQVWKDSANFTDEERAVLQYTDEVSVDVKVKNATFEAVRQYLNERSIVELTISIGYWGMVARVLVPLEVDIDDKSVGSNKDLFGRTSRGD
jgi:alkylhydroperoxidase family enzyme